MSVTAQQLHEYMLNLKAATPNPDQMRYDRDFVIDRHMIARDDCVKSSDKFTIINSTMNPSPNAKMSPVKILPENVISLHSVIKRGEGVWEGKFLICRCVTPSFKFNAIQFVVDDPEGDVVVNVLLYSYYSEAIPTGTIFALMNPYFKLTNAGHMALRCDNPIVHFEILDDDHPILQNITWKHSLKMPIGVQTIADIDLNKAGVLCFENKHYDEAIKLFTRAITSSGGDKKILANSLCNRSASYIAVELPCLALEDAERGLKLDPDNFKLQIRKGHALLDLSRFEECIQFVTSIEKSSHLDGILLDARRALKEAKYGKYDYCFMYNQAKKNAYLHGYANYFASDLVEVKVVANYGRGLVAKQDIAGGTLIIAEKAFAFDVEDNSRRLIFGIDQSKQRAYSGSTKLLAKIGAKLKRNPVLGKDLYNLLAGKDYLDLSIEEAKEKHVDVERIKEILLVNAIESGRSSETSVAAGLWIKPSYINHSCVDVNCVGQFIGDFMFVRTVKPIEKGEQLLFQYCSDELFKNRDQNLRIVRGFTCECRLCELERKEPDNVHETMAAIRQRFLKITDDYLQGKLQVDPAPELQVLLDKCWDLRPSERLLNLVALKISKTLAMISISQKNICLITDACSAYEHLCLISEALDAASGIEICYKELGNSKNSKSWRAKVKKLAKLMFGDEQLFSIITGDNK